MNYIYKILCNKTGNVYFGKCNGNYNRLASHKCKNNQCASYPIIQGGNYQFIILEEYINDENISEREAYYITNFECVNKTIPYTVLNGKIERHREKEKERYYSNVDFYKQKSLNNYYLNQSIISQKRKETIICECGITIQKSNKSRHLKSILHQKNVMI